MRRSLAAGVLLGALLAGCASGAGDQVVSEPPDTPPIGTLAPGDPLPDAVLPVLGGEGAIDTGDLGGPAVLNFWATWCAFCVDEMPDLERAHQALGDDVRFVGIDREDPNVDRALELAAETGVTYELVTDADGSFFRAVQARGMPTTVFVDAAGTIRYRHAGPLTTEQLLELAEEHLDV